MKIDIQQKEIVNGIRFSASIDGNEVGRAYLYVLHNDLHNRPFGFMEDVFVLEEARGKGVGTAVCKELIATAEKLGCYKLIGCSRHSRPKVHEIYLRLGFTDHGKEFRMNFPLNPEE